MSAAHSHMLARVACLAIGAVIVGIGCATGPESREHSAAPPTGSPTETSGSERPTTAMPEWVMATPSIPGIAIFGVGSCSFKLDTQINRAMRESDAQARRQIAETMGQKIEGMIRTYASGVVTEDGPITEESLSQDVMRAFLHRCVQGASIIRKFTTTAPDANGLFYTYSLAAVDFAHTVNVLADSAVNPKAVEAVRERAAQQFSNLTQQLLRAQTGAYPDAKSPLPPIAGEVVPDDGTCAFTTPVWVAIPQWVWRTPSVPGVAIYGAGLAAIAGKSAVANAVAVAESNARAQAAAVIEKIVRRVVAAYADAAGLADFRAVTTDAVNAVHESCVAEAPIIRRVQAATDEGSRRCVAFALVEIEFRAVLDALLLAVLHSPANGGDHARIRSAFANAATVAIMDQRYHSHLDAGPVPPPIAGEIVVATAITE